MHLTRRHFLTTAAATTLAPTAWAGTSLTSGNRSLDSLSDGHLMLPGSFFFSDLGADQLSNLISTYDLNPDMLTPACNVTLLRDGERTILFDVGSGTDFMSSAGELPDALAAMGLSSDDITDVVFTHAHPDHLWGLLDDFDDPMFANANFKIGRAEWDYWTNPNTIDDIGTDRQTFAVGAARRLAAIEDQIEFFDDGQEILPGVAARATYGHTPGHMSFEVNMGSESVLITGDCIGNHHLAFEYPEYASGSDQDKTLGATTRTKIMDELASRQMTMIGYHLPNGGIGRVERKGNAYRFVPS
jgi:glyoxylase-like metal-dependent hydrolase (beta-lactamase superfamily II)